MKFSYLIGLLLGCTTTLWAQEPDNTKDNSTNEVATMLPDSSGIDSINTQSSTASESSSTTFVLKNPLVLGKRRVKTRFLLFEMGINSYHNQGQLNIPADLETYELRHGRSLEINLHFYRQRIRIGKGYFNIEHGLSLDFNNYAFQNDVNYQTDPTKMLFIDNSVDMERSRLYVSHLVLPIMFRFETNPQRLGRSFHFGIGAYGSIRVGSNLRTKQPGQTRDITVDDFGLNDFNAGLRGEIGYGPINLYVKYGLTDLFKEGQGPDLTPFSIGLILLPF